MERFNNRVREVRRWFHSEILGLTATQSPPRPAAENLTPSERVLLNGSRFASTRKPRIVWKLVFFIGLFLAGFGLVMASAPLWVPPENMASSPLDAVASSIGFLIVPGLAFAYIGRPKKDRIKVTPAFDSDEYIDVETFVIVLLGAALLAREADDVIRLELVDGDDPSLLVRHGNGDASYPRATLEARLTARDGTSFEDLVFDWMGSHHATPWHRAITQVHIMATIRGLLSAPGVDGTDYKPVTKNAKIDPHDDAAVIESTQKNRSAIWKFLERDIRAAVRRRTADAYSENYSPTDPWMDERPTDRGMFSAGPSIAVVGSKTSGFFAAVFTGAMLWIAAGMWAFYPDAGYAVEIWIAISVLLVGVACLPSRPFRKFTTRVWNFFENAPGSNVNLSIGPLGKQIIGLVTGTPMLIIAGSVALSYPLVAAAVGLFIAARLILIRYKARALSALQSAVTGEESTVSEHVVENSAEEATNDFVHQQKEQTTFAKVSHSNSDTTLAELPFELQILNADLLPSVSPPSQTRIDEAVAHRLLPLYAMSLMLFAAAVTGALYISTRDDSGVSVALVISVILLVITTLIVGSAIYSSRRLSKVNEKARNDPSLDGEMRRFLNVFQPEQGLRNLGRIWALLAVVGPAFLSTAHFICLALTGSWVFGVNWRARLLQRRHQNQWPSRQLLALRVFDSPYLDEFLNLSDMWRWMGPIMRLHGPDTVVADVRMVRNYFAGRIDDHVIKSHDELKTAISEIRREPDLGMRYPINSLQCSEGVWRDAVRTLVEQSAIAVVDLSSLSTTNLAVAWEVRLLVNRMPFSHTVLLIHDSTDMQVFERMLADAIADMSPASPNADAATRCPLIIHMGGTTERLEEESHHDWRQRMQERVNGEQLVGLLLDAARS